MSRPGPPPVPGGGRSEDERERARREREARRRKPRHQQGTTVAALENRLRRMGGSSNGGAPGPARRRNRIAIAAVLLVGLVVLWFLVSLFQPLHGDGGEEVQVVVPKGASFGEVADLLEEKGVIDSTFFFNLRASLAGKRGDVKAGAHTLREDMSFTAALDELSETPQKTTVTVTLPEGRSRYEAATFVRSAGLAGDYEKATDGRHRLLDPSDYDAPRGATLEGFLWPATYELRGGGDVEALVRRQLTAFKENFETVDLSAARRANLTAYDVLIIASLIEREVAVPRERRLVASVIYNRLSRGEPLGIDATTRYETRNWTEPLVQSVLEEDTPYNTRINAGLPPGPIGSPGLASIEAAARPADTDYMYYVAKVCGNGAHEFASTQAEHDANVARYNQERERRGGQSPTDC